MQPTHTQQQIVDRFFKAMQAGRDAEASLMALFTDDATLIEPFSGERRTSHGLDAVRESFRCTWDDPMPDVVLQVNRVDVENNQVRAEWSCTAPAFASPIRGHDLFDIRDDKIARLEIIVTEMPTMVADGEGA